ncbi:MULTISPECIES: 23S rRNA (adenine(1618)-N(6))-methyltransferase RlmF [Pseudomonas]|uniref:Ribosomal RNA large subunit methyltransferase F n=2 Tax=Pseudomonadaceae TaxID=135621 RepID=A0A0D0KIE1_9PSED|nr:MULTISPECIES: 23S rRNA (adenine(1618)-N(6))-methyltransferase RlmF [Pseudomonas]KIP97839.1 23S rRNA methyltransferase [Pseudomonas fulva]MCW2293822.1 23S rRNA (adenine1618-N6)-methyltransferase [Pseudomonas sp. BIGb0408]NYH71608.1 23S rRNA (adenine1618-N6)-methyltransferase [Pseudomonas flavescens]
MSAKRPPKPSAPSADKGQLHPRNRHQGRYDFPALIKTSPELAAFVIINPYGKESIDFANPAAVKVFNRALLRQFYGITHWDIPADYLCPPIPGRADYLHYLADLLATDNTGEIPRGATIRALDIGVGANCIYPLLGNREYGWHFLGADIASQAIASAKAIVQSNQGLSEQIDLRLQPDAGHVFSGLLKPEERFELTLCNPPFHASADEAASGSKRKWRNLGKLDPKRKLPVLNFGGQAAELWCPGGEAAFVARLIRESADHREQVLWFSTLISKSGNLPGVYATLKKVGAVETRTVEMSQGQKQSRFVAWTFHDAEQRRRWLQAR